MGVSLSSKDAVQDVNMSYSTFNELRKVIADIYDENFGKLYAEHSYMCMRISTKEDADVCNEVADKANDIARAKDLSLGIRDFLWASDCDGEVTYDTCKDLWELLRHKENDHMYFEPFKELVEYCVDEEQGFYWL